MRRLAWPVVAAVVALVLLVEPASAAAQPSGLSSVLDPTGAIGKGIKAITGVVVGGFEWTTDVAGDFIVNTLGGLVDLLIPDSWAHQGLAIMRWVVAVPNYAAQITAPGGAQSYAFAGINDLRDLFVWIGIALLPLSLTYASTRAMFGLGDHVAMPVIRTLVVGVVLISYTWLWGQFAAIANQITRAILGVPTVADGINKLFEFVVGGGVLVGGLPLIGLIVTGAAGAGLLAAIFVKVLMILIGALVYVTGPLMIGVAPTERGAAAARAWLTLATGLFVLPVIWALVFSISALLMNDSTGAGAIIATNSDLGQLLGGLVLAMAAIAGFWLNLKLTRFAVAILGGQIAGMLALATSGGGSSAAAGRGAPSNARDALRSFGSRVSGALSGGSGPLAASGRTGAALTAVGGGAGALARGGLRGVTASLVKQGAGAAAASSAGQALGGTKAGALATRMARAGRSGWKNPTAATPRGAGSGAVGSGGASTNDESPTSAAQEPRSARRGSADSRQQPASRVASRTPGAAPAAVPSTGARPDAPSRAPVPPSPRADSTTAKPPLAAGRPASESRSTRRPRLPRRRKDR
jgi:hypothetical protein